MGKQKPVPANYFPWLKRCSDWHIRYVHAVHLKPEGPKRKRERKAMESEHKALLAEHNGHELEDALTDIQASLILGVVHGVDAKRRENWLKQSNGKFALILGVGGAGVQQFTPAPEPSTFLLLGLGALGLVRRGRRRIARA